MPVASVHNVWKNFQAVTALRDVSLSFEAGSVHVLLGENGAGKSTLIGLLAGLYRPDSGHVSIEGVPTTISSPLHARQLGISPVYQEPALVPQLSVTENLTLGREPMMRGFLDRRRQRKMAEEALYRVGSAIPLDALPRDLSRADQQVVEIARALQGSARLLILDEPTAALTEDETGRLFDIVRRLREQGIAMIYITHRMGEIRQIGDRVSVLRDGTLVGSSLVADIADGDLVALMIGRKVEALFPETPHHPREGGLELRNLCDEAVRDITLKVNRGEIVGLTGLVGSGKSEIGKLCFGLRHPTSGNILIDGSDAGVSSPRHRLANGVMHYPADRKRDGLIGVRPARENVTLSSLGRWSRGPFVDHKSERRAATSILERLALRPSQPEALPTTFSGGNQQKIVLGRGFTQPYVVHIFDEPTAGVDIGARAEIYNAMKELALAGSAVLVISSDLPEIVNLVHRAYVIAQGRVVGEFTGDEVSEENLLPHFFTEVGAHA